jgi:hypothetical protein
LKRVCNEIPNDFKFKHFENFEINFTHFIDAPLTNGTLDIIYNQQAALFFGGTFPGVDKIIVLNHKVDRNRYGLLLIQTKNYSEHFPLSKALEFIYLCNPGLFKQLTKIQSMDIATLLVSVGGNSFDSSVQVSYCEWNQFPSMGTREKTSSDWLCIATSLHALHLPISVKSNLWNMAHVVVRKVPPTLDDAIGNWGQIGLTYFIEQRENARCMNKKPSRIRW